MTDPEIESLFRVLPMAEQERMVEAILFAVAGPVTLAELATRLPKGTDPAEALAHLTRRYAAGGCNWQR